MENKTELHLLRVRSLAAVVSDGYRLYMGTFRTLFRASWIAALVYALAFALFIGNVVNNIIPLSVTMPSLGAAPSSSALALYSLSILFYMAAIPLLAAQAVRIMREHSATGEVSRVEHWYGRFCAKEFLQVLVAGLWMLLLGIAIDAFLFAVTYGVLSLGVVGSVWRSVAFGILMLVLALAVVAVCIPFYYTVMRVFVSVDKLQVLPPVKGYARGFRHWGLLFATVLVVGIFTGLLTFVCELPAFIMAAANTLAYVGLAKGDPLGMPEGIMPLTYIVFFVAGFIQAYVHLSTLYPFYYAYGCIEEQERETIEH